MTPRISKGELAKLKKRPKVHRLVRGSVEIPSAGRIIARCECGWTSGPCFSGFIASDLFAEHQEAELRREVKKQ